jgi:outer membrane murein-binding lipoprotein Lpp
MSAEEYKALCDSIADLGVQNPITLFEGMVLDGWHRYQAAQSLAMDFKTQELADWVDPTDFVIAQNKVRRHITQSQLAMAATAAYTWRSLGVNQHSEKRVVSGEPPAKTNAEVAAIAGVGVSSIKRAKVVQSQAIPEVNEAVKRGEVGLKKAASIAKLPKEEQAEALHKPMPKPAPKPAPEPEREQEPAPEQEPEYSELDAARDQISDLQRDLVVALMGNVPEDQKTQAASKIDELNAEIKSLSAQLDAVTKSLEAYMNENAAMKNQMAAQRRELQKLRPKA